MQMLVAGGLRHFGDNTRPADAHNPRGYYEHRAVMASLRSTSWLFSAQGKVAKVVIPLVDLLPKESFCGVILVRRPVADILASQNAMLEAVGQGGLKSHGTRMEQLLEHQWQQTQARLREKDAKVLTLDYAAIRQSPVQAGQAIADFLPGTRLAGSAHFDAQKAADAVVPVGQVVD